ncbi:MULTISPECIES: AsmA family protein [Pseudoalteromonas]|uniref:Membrane assembly protein AsmA n=1 Tax=Pseudoalteromonas amylolytica TaxID=1859457 RepID=A0A1S1MRH9_9GAMM|nr:MULTISPECIES: AsmA family protein [Pseudoalteromonas]OHU86004.1 membrane assembly protein AsmA [Pseudoalteromonas sp. JW3]OHU89386.1 membrane assembly protein AsmA [Pseudoalteromonas amylolytica]
MKTALKILVGAIVLLMVVAVAAPFFVPTERIISELSEQVELNTGRQLQIKGQSELSVIPSLKIELNDVHFANATTGSRPDMISMQSLEVYIPWLSIFTGEAKLEKFVIRKPDILLETDKNGIANWQILPEQPTPTRTETEQQSSKPTSLPEGFDIKLGEVAIYGGKFTFKDGQTGAQHQLSDIDVSVQLPSLYETLAVAGAMTYQQQAFELNATLATPVKLLKGEAFTVTQTINSALVDMNFKGEVAQMGKDIQGDLSLKGDSVKAIAQWQGVDLNAKEDAFNAFEVTGSMRMQKQTFTLEQLSAKLDALSISGKSTVGLGGRLNVKANVDLGMLDLNPYLPEPVAQPEEPSEPEGAAPIVWDDTKLNLSALNALDANVVVRSTGLKAREIKLGKNQLSLTLKNGAANLSLDEFNAYEGVGQGTVKVDASRVPYKVNAQFKLDNINAEPLLTDAVGFDKVLGKGGMQWQLATQGQSQKDFVSALAGKFNFDLKDGGVKGANIAEMTRQAKEMLKGDFSSLKEGLNADFNPDQKTDFSSLTGSLIFTNGVGRNTDLYLASPLIRITGEGEVDLPQTNVNYRLVTGIVDTIEGQASSDDSTGFKIPLRIKGPFHKVDVNLDVSSTAKDKLKDKAKDKLKDKLKGLFGG